MSDRSSYEDVAFRVHRLPACPKPVGPGEPCAECISAIADLSETPQPTLFELGDLLPWQREWQSMPEYTHRDLEAKHQVIVNFATSDDVADFGRLVGTPLRATSSGRQLQSIWYPPQEIGRYKNKRYIEPWRKPHRPKYPIFIPTKGRADSRMTIKMFDALDVPYTIFVEPQEVETYAKVVARERIHVLPHRDRGLTVTRNYIWDYAEAIGTEWFWTFDDNIAGLYRFNDNLKTPCADATILAVIEDFAARYTNVVIAGMNYFMFVSRKVGGIPPYYLNTRVYSNMLIRTSARRPDGSPYRNVTFFNDDTDLCLRVLKDGWCTVLFNAFLIDKAVTMSTSGGMTDYYLRTNKRYEFAEELRQAHPDVVKITEKWGRWQHQVDYTGFKQQLKRRSDLSIPSGVDNYGLVLQERVEGVWGDLR